MTIVYIDPTSRHFHYIAFDEGRSVLNFCGTIEMVKEFFNKRTKVIRTDASLGGARYLGMRVVDTEWFAFIDSDVEILPGLFEAANSITQYFMILDNRRSKYRVRLYYATCKDEMP